MEKNSKEQSLPQLKSYQENTQFSSFLDILNDGFWDWDIKNDFEFMSPNFWKMFGYDHKEKRHHPSEWQKILHPEDLPIVLENFENHVKSKGKHPFQQIVRYYHKNGNILYILCKGKVIEWDKYGNPMRMVGTHTDETEKILTQKELDIEITKRTHNSRMNTLSEFSARIAHEINNPLTVILGQLQLLKKMAPTILQPKSKAKLQKHVLKIENTSKKIGTILSSLKFLTKQSDSKLNKTEIINVLTNSLILIEKVLEHNGIQIKFKHLPNNELIANINPTAFSQIILNILNNAKAALIFSKVPKPEIFIDILVDEFIEINISNNGNKIPDKNLELIFEPFYTTNDIFNGSGLGLSISKSLIESYGGKILVKNTELGVMFTLIFKKSNPLIIKKSA